MTLRQSQFLPLIAAGVLLTGIFGCPQKPAPAPESVLEGSWQLVPTDRPDPPLTSCILTFDSNGQLSEVSYTVAGNASVTWDQPPATVSVDGDAVRISVAQGASSLVFDGKLNSTTAPTRADGELTSNLIVGDITASVSEGAASLIKQ